MMRGVWYVGWGMKDRGQRKMGNGGGKVWDVGDDVGRGTWHGKVMWGMVWEVLVRARDIAAPTTTHRSFRDTPSYPS